MNSDRNMPETGKLPHGEAEVRAGYRLEGRDIICLSGYDWDPLWTRKQQLLSRFPKSNRILYVETPITLLSPIKDPTLWYKWPMWFKGLRQTDENIWLYSPPVLLPFANQVGGINGMNQSIIASATRRQARKLGFKKPILLTYFPNSIDLVGKLGETLVAYDCVDDHPAFQGFNKEVVWNLERRLLERADISFTTSKDLYDERLPHARELHLIRNAANYDHYSKALDPGIEMPADLQGIPGPRIGFVGRIKEWIDMELIGRLARLRPDWSFVMIGPVEHDADVQSCQGLDNIHFLGMKPWDVVPQYLRFFDVCLNPFRQSQLAKAVSPLKVYEYLAAGCPVVSSPMPQVEELGAVVAVAAGVEGSLSAIEEALKDTPERLEARLAAAREHTWENRVQRFTALLAKRLEEVEQGE